MNNTEKQLTQALEEMRELRKEMKELRSESAVLRETNQRLLEHIRNLERDKRLQQLELDDMKKNMPINEAINKFTGLFKVRKH